MQNSSSSTGAAAANGFSVVCLCAEWCGTCRDYRGDFDALSGEFPEMRFTWCDIEEDAAVLGDLDVENFPTLLIRRDDTVLFFGVMLPYAGHLARLLESFREQTADESRVYANAHPERKNWQGDPDLLRIGRA